MTKEYQDLQHLDNEENDHHQLRRGEGHVSHLKQEYLVTSCSLSLLFSVTSGSVPGSDALTWKMVAESHMLGEVQGTD